MDFLGKMGRGGGEEGGEEGLCVLLDMDTIEEMVGEMLEEEEVGEGGEGKREESLLACAEKIQKTFFDVQVSVGGFRGGMGGRAVERDLEGVVGRLDGEVVGYLGETALREVSHLPLAGLLDGRKKEKRGRERVEGGKRVAGEMGDEEWRDFCFSGFLFYFILFYFILFYFILFYFILFYFILFYFILFYFILFYFILFYFILFYFILFYFILFYFIFFSFLFFSFLFCYFLFFYFLFFSLFSLFYFILFFHLFKFSILNVLTKIKSNLIDVSLDIEIPQNSSGKPHVFEKKKSILPRFGFFFFFFFFFSFLPHGSIYFPVVGKSIDPDHG